MALLRKQTTKKGAVKPVPKVGVVEAAASTALARVDPVVAIDEPHSRQFLREAQRLDEKIQKSIDRLQKDVQALGAMFLEMQQKEYHRVLVGRDGRPYTQFQQYLKERWPEKSPSVINSAMRIARELTGTVDDQDIREMTRANAEQLAKLKQQGHDITPDLVEEAKTMNIRQFRDEVDALLPEQAQRDRAERGEELASEPEVMVKRTFYLSGLVASRLAKAIKIADRLTEGEPELSYDDRTLGAIAANFLASFEADYETVMASDDAHMRHVAMRAEPLAAEDEDEESEKEEEDEEGDEEQEQPEPDEEEVTARSVPSCRGVKENGDPCQSPAMRGGDYCYYHSKVPRAAQAG